MQVFQNLSLSKTFNTRSVACTVTISLMAVKFLAVSSLASFRRIPLQDIPCDSIEDTSKWCREAFQEKVNKCFLHHTNDKYFPALFSCVIFLPVTCLPHLSPLTYFPALTTGYIFSRAYHRLHLFPRLTRIPFFQYNILPRLLSLTHFPALFAGYILLLEL